MIRIKLIPTSGGYVNELATNHAFLAGKLENVNIPEESPMSNWKDINRIVPSHGKYIMLELPGEIDEYSENSLNGITNAITADIPVEPHPDGWYHVP